MGLQSIGRWPSFLAYSAIGAGVVWIGLFTNIVCLVIASMLISSFAEPDMTLAMASTAGDRLLLRRSALRYVGALIMTIVVTAGLSLLFGQRPVTSRIRTLARSRGRRRSWH